MKDTSIKRAFDVAVIAAETIDGLRKKTVSVNEAKATNALLATIHHNLALRQEQARLSGARVDGDVIMDIQLDPDAKPSPSTQIGETTKTTTHKLAPSNKAAPSRSKDSF